MTHKIGDDYQKLTKYHRDRMSGGPDWTSQAPPFKLYKSVPHVKLPPPEQDGGPPLWNVIRSRRSERDFDQERTISAGQVSTVLWAAQGITEHLGSFPLRSVPSAGALYPVETYIALGNVSSIDPGIYHLDLLGWRLERLSRGDPRPALARAALDQEMVLRAAATLVMSTIIDRSKWKYGERAYRYMYLDAGHIGQNVALAAKALGMGSCAVGAFFDDEVDAVFGLDGEQETAIYLTCFGPITP
ncbi:MAG: SagB/ThcOx family dehydrogenase [Candidatus Alcyoniella australis]|nr:SagB/ThcOx family dehydrogenase [Candidatus Alcyoniella australis]